MAMRTASPWWTSVGFAVGLLLLFIGERAFAHKETVRLVASTGGALIVVGLTAARAYTTLASRGGRRRVERTLLWCHLGAALALGLYALTTHWGLGVLGLTHMSKDGAHRYDVVMHVLAFVLLAASLIPMYMIEISLGVARREEFDLKSTDDDSGVEYFRVREIGWSGPASSCSPRPAG